MQYTFLFILDKISEVIIDSDLQRVVKAQLTLQGYGKKKPLSLRSRRLD